MRWVLGTVGTLLALVAAAFTIQNSVFQAPLQLDLYVAAWKLSRPASVPVLMWAAFGAGAVLGAGLVGGRSARLASRVRQLEQEAAVAGTRAPAARDPWAG